MKNKTAKFSGSLFVIDKVDKDEQFVEFSNIYITKVIYSNPATIVFWSDGTKTVSKCSGGDTYSKETGLSICIMKRLVGATELRKIFIDWLPEKVDADEEFDGEERIYLKDVRRKNKNK